MNPKQNFTYLEVVRPVSGADEFLTRATALARRIFQTEDNFTVLQITDERLTGDNGPLVVGAPFEVCRVFNADNIRIPLLERKTIPETRTGSTFSNAARILTNGRIKTYSNQKSAKMPLTYEVEPLKKQLLYVQLEHDFPDPNNVMVVLDKIDDRFSSDSLSGDIELVLLPKLDEASSVMLREQSRKCAEELVRISRKIAYPNNYQRLEIPFARVSGKASMYQLGRYVQALGSLLPLHLSASEPRITSQTSS